MQQRFLAARGVGAFAIACLIVAGCDQRSIVEPSLPDLRSVSDECSTTCALTSDERPFRQAAAQRDTAGLSTHIADIEISGVQGAVVLLRALKDDAFLMTDRPVLEVEIGGEVQRLSYVQALKGAVVYRFEKPETIRIRY